MAFGSISKRNLPPPQSAFVDKDTLNLSYDGYQFLLDLINNATSGLTQASISANVAGAGGNQATAAQLTSQWNVIASGAANSGVLLGVYQPGESQQVFNQSGSAKLIYPPPGYQIDGLGINAAYSLAGGKMQIFNFVSSAQIDSTQLG